MHHKIWISLLHSCIYGIGIGEVNGLQQMALLGPIFKLIENLLDGCDIAGVAILSRLNTVAVLSRSKRLTTAPPMNPPPPVISTRWREPSSSAAVGIEKS